jgi:hypothetical protein
MAVGRDGQNLIGAEPDESGNRDSSVNERYPHAPRSHGMTGRPRCGLVTERDRPIKSPPRRSGVCLPILSGCCRDGCVGGRASHGSDHH